MCYREVCSLFEIDLHDAEEVKIWFIYSIMALNKCRQVAGEQHIDNVEILVQW